MYLHEKYRSHINEGLLTTFIFQVVFETPSNFFGGHHFSENWGKCWYGSFDRELNYNVPFSPTYGVFILQLIRYDRVCSFRECFIIRIMWLSNKLLGQGYVRQHLKSSLVHDRYGDFIKQYEVPLYQIMTFWSMNICSDTFHNHYTKSWPCYQTGPDYRVWFFL